MYHKDIGSCEMYRHKTNARVQIPEGEKFMNERNVRPFSKRDEIGYVFGDMAGSFVNLFVDAYFLTFCTYVLGISPAWMGSLFLAARLWDAGKIEETSKMNCKELNTFKTTSELMRMLLRQNRH